MTEEDFYNFFLLNLPHTSDVLNACNSHNNSMIHEAVTTKKCSPDRLKMLIDFGFVTNHCNSDGLRPIVIAFVENDIEKIKMMMECGVDLDKNDWEKLNGGLNNMLSSDVKSFLNQIFFKSVIYLNLLIIVYS